MPFETVAHHHDLVDPEYVLGELAAEANFWRRVERERRCRAVAPVRTGRERRRRSVHRPSRPTTSSGDPEPSRARSIGGAA